jgi:hypothetical protein
MPGLRFAEGGSMKKPRYETEVALCADFIAWVKRSAGQRAHGSGTIPKWTPYAETAGWDILLAAEDGTQIGVQAKLKFNMKVLQQAVPECWDHWHDRGPDYRAILVPEQDSGQMNLCAALGLTMFWPTGPRWMDQRVDFNPGLDMEHWNGGWHYWSPRKRCELPEFVPDVQAGASAPVQLTKWKIAALRIVATLDVCGHVTRQDFKAHGVDPRRWTGPGGWLVPRSERMQDAGQFIRGPGLDFDRQHPDVYAQVLAEVRAKLDAAPDHIRVGALFTEAA